VNEPPAELLRRLQPIPTYRDHPATTPHDVVGVDPRGAPLTIPILGSTAPVLLLFLSADCLGCQDIWLGLDEVRAGLPEGTGLVVVTAGPEAEDSGRIAALAGAGTGVETEIVMSTQAFADYRVAGAPFLVLVDAEAVRTEGVAWGIAETVRAARAGLGD
jgi:hypothetical protein